MLELQAESCPLNSQTPEHCSWLLISCTHSGKLFLSGVTPHLHTPESCSWYVAASLLHAQGKCSRLQWHLIYIHQKIVHDIWRHWPPLHAQENCSRLQWYLIYIHQTVALACQWHLTYMHQKVVLGVSISSFLICLYEQDGEGRTAVFVVLLLSFVLLLRYSPGHTKMGKWKGAGISVCSYEYCRCWCKIKKV